MQQSELFVEESPVGEPQPPAQAQREEAELQLRTDDSSDAQVDVLIEIQRYIWPATSEDIAKTRGEDAEASCSICLEDMQAESSVSLSCGHCLHAACAQASECHGLLEKGFYVCPECRGVVSSLRAVFPARLSEQFRTNKAKSAASWSNGTQETTNSAAVVMSTSPDVPDAGLRSAGGLNHVIKASAILTCELLAMLDVSVDGYELAKDERQTQGDRRHVDAPVTLQRRVSLAEYMKEIIEDQFEDIQHQQVAVRHNVRFAQKYRRTMITTLVLLVCFSVWANTHARQQGIFH
jgi:hypothetical protein